MPENGNGTIDYAAIDYEHFDLEQYLEEVRDDIPRPNIMICGGTGVGKSSLVNSIFRMELAEVGSGGVRGTEGIRRYTTKDALVTLYDSEGYEIGGPAQEHYYADILGVIGEKRRKAAGQISEQIHEVWYCVSAGGKRFLDADRDVIEAVRLAGIPVCVILTKVDTVDEEELEQLKREVRRSLRRGRLGRIQAAAGKNEPRRQPEEIEIFTWSAMLDDAPPEIRDAYVQREPLLSWASEHLDESLRYALLSAVKGGIREKRELLVKEVIPKYMLRAGGIVTATSFVTVPFTDSVALTGLQTLMAGEIIRFFGIDSDVKDVAKGLAGASLVSYCGRTLSTQLISLIPVVNGAVKTAVNLSVAVSLTGTLGAAMAYLCEQYLTFCVDLNGKANLPFSDFLTEERILAAMKLVQGSLGKDGERVSGKTTAKELAQYFVKQMLNDLMKGSGWKS